MSDKIRVLLPEEEVEERIRQIGKQITEDYANEEVFLICTLKGASFFACVGKISVFLCVIQTISYYK